MTLQERVELAERREAPADMQCHHKIRWTWEFDAEGDDLVCSMCGARFRLVPTGDER